MLIPPLPKKGKKIAVNSYSMVFWYLSIQFIRLEMNGKNLVLLSTERLKYCKKCGSG